MRRCTDRSAQLLAALPDDVTRLILDMLDDDERSKLAYLIAVHGPMASHVFSHELLRARVAVELETYLQNDLHREINDTRSMMPPAYERTPELHAPLRVFADWSVFRAPIPPSIATLRKTSHQVQTNHRAIVNVAENCAQRQCHQLRLTVHAPTVRGGNIAHAPHYCRLFSIRSAERGQRENRMHIAWPHRYHQHFVMGR